VAEKTDEQILSLCTTSKEWTFLLKNATIPEVIHLWTRISNINDPTTRRKGHLKVQRFLLKKTHLSNLPKLHLSIPYTMGMSQANLIRIANSLVTKILPEEIAKDISRQLTVVTKNRLSIASTLKNNTKLTFQKDLPPNCLGLPYCKDGQHYSQRIHEKGGPSSLLKDVNANSIPIPDTNLLASSLHVTLADLAKKVAILQRLCNSEQLQDIETHSKTPPGEVKKREPWNLVNNAPLDLAASFVIWEPNKAFPMCIVPYKTVAYLWATFNNKKDAQPAVFPDTLTAVATAYKRDLRNYEKLPTNLTSVLVKLLNCNVARTTQPISWDTLFPYYNSQSDNDSILGSLGNPLAKQWTTTGFILITPTTKSQLNLIKHAILSYAFNAAESVVIHVTNNQEHASDSAKSNEHNKLLLSLLKHSTVRLIVKWASNSFYTLKNDNMGERRMHKTQVHLYRVSNKLLDKKTREEINATLRIIYCPPPSMEEPPNSSTTLARQQQYKKARKQPSQNCQKKA